MKNVGTPFAGAGGSHTSGFVPDPGSTAGTAKFLCEDSTFKLPQEIIDLSTADASFFSLTPFYDPLAIPAVSGTTNNARMTLSRLFGLLRPSPGQRLYLATGVPVALGVSSTTLYCGPYEHDIITLWDGTRWVTFRLPEFAMPLGTLVNGAGYDVFVFTSTATPSSTNTSTEIVTFASPTGWATGSVVYPASTVGGLLFTGSPYYYNAASSTTGSFHTTLADALAGTNKANLTANITQALTAVSLEIAPWKNATVTISNASPGVVTWNSHGLNSINFYDPVTFTTTGSLPTGLTANTVYYAQSVTTNTFRVATEPAGASVNTSSAGSGTHTAWQSRARQTDVTIQDGRYCKSGDKTRLHLGSFRASSTTQTCSLDSQRNLWNRYNRVPLRLYNTVVATHTYNGGWRFFNGSAASKAEFFTGEIQHMAVSVWAEMVNAANAYQAVGLAIDRPDLPNLTAAYLWPTPVINTSLGNHGTLETPTVGSHLLAGLESSGSLGSSSFYNISIHALMMG